MRLLFALLFLFAPPAIAETPCGADAPCNVDGGEYYLSFPADWDGVSPLPAILFFHGHRSSGLSPLKSKGLREDFVSRGYLLISPNGAARPDGVRAWPSRPGHGGGRDDVAFTLSVLDDAAARAPLDANRILVSGFSAGGSMAWMMGCYAGERFAAVISVAGALRRPNPDRICPNGVKRALHVHGFKDSQVPFEGRGIREWHQGDVFETLALFRRTNRCRSNPDAIEIGERWRSRVWTSCAGGDLAYLEHPGGHGLPRGWTARAREWFETGRISVD